MTPAQKIERLLEITGTPTDRKELARANYNRLLKNEGENAIDARIAEFETMHLEVNEWREQRALRKAVIRTTEDQTPLANFLVREKAVLRRVSELLDTMNLRAVQKHSIHANAAAADLNDKVRKIAEAFADSEKKFGLSFKNETKNIFTVWTELLHGASLYKQKTEEPWKALALQMRVIDDVYKQLGETDAFFRSVTTHSRIDTERAISGLGSIANYVSQATPDALFVLNEGGALVGDFIKTHLGLEIPIVRLAGDTQKLEPLSTALLPKNVSHPIIIDDVSRSGGTIRKAFSWLKARYPGALPRATAMAASVQAIEVIGSAPFHTPHPTEDVSVRMPYDTRAGFEVVRSERHKMYVFGAHAESSADRLLVPAETVDKVVAEQNRILAN